MNVRPDFIKGEIRRREYDGISNDLLTGGLGKTGLKAPHPFLRILDPKNYGPSPFIIITGHWPISRGAAATEFFTALT